MKYRRFGTLDWEVSVLGFGVMRLPLINEDPTLINESASIKFSIEVNNGKLKEFDIGEYYFKK